jgi:hypothetical protein
MLQSSHPLAPLVVLLDKQQNHITAQCSPFIVPQSPPPFDHLRTLGREASRAREEGTEPMRQGLNRPLFRVFWSETPGQGKSYQIRLDLERDNLE